LWDWLPGTQHPEIAFFGPFEARAAPSAPITPHRVGRLRSMDRPGAGARFQWSFLERNNPEQSIYLIQNPRCFLDSPFSAAMASLPFLTLFLSFLLACPATQARTWDEARALATATTAQLTLDEKVGILIGKGQFGSRCVGDTGPVSRLNIPNLCMNDGPAGLRATKGGTGFPTGINTASTFSRRLMRARGVALGEEFRGKGVRVYLGPAMDIMRSPKAGEPGSNAL